MALLPPTIALLSSLVAAQPQAAAPPAAQATSSPAAEPEQQQQRNDADASAEQPAGPLPEGVFVVERPATLRRTDNNQWVFVFEDPSLPSMLAMPSLNLMAMRRLTENQRGASHRFLVSGEVFTHRGRNHLLVTRFVAQPVAPQKAEAPQAEAPQEASSASAPSPPALPPPSNAKDDPSVAELIEALERATPEVDADRLSRAAQRASPSQAQSGAGLLREGALLTNRAGRVLRDGAGRVVFLVDTDADSAPSAEPPMRLAPSLTSMALEAAVEALGGEAAVVVSGRVLLYEGENYLLPTSFQLRRLPAGDLSAAQ